MRRTPAIIRTLCLGLGLVAIASQALALDLTGRWRVELSGGPPYADIVQTGSAVTIVMDFSSAVFTFDGTVSGNSVLATSDDGPCPVNMSLRVLPDESTMDGVGTVYGGPCTIPSKSRVFATRCECFDGNEISGDGCDAECRVEPCFSCTPEPSICTPSSDGAACDDRADCTTGETCGGGVCGGGAVISPCVDLNGRWLQVTAGTPVGVIEQKADIHQRDGIVVVRRVTDATLGAVGTIDPPSGVLDLSIPGLGFFCGASTFSGTAAPDGRVYSGSGSAGVDTLHGCVYLPFDEQGFRCGGGTLDPGEGCDDGNQASGDGCDASCAVEPCHTCDASEPSQCMSLPDATPCDDGDPCSAGDNCSDGQCTGAPTQCPACTICDPAGLCTPGPRSGCRVSVESSKTRLLLSDSAVDARDAFRWQWKNGEATGPSAFGHPATTSSLTLCLFDQSGADPVVAFQAVVAPGEICATSPCWRALPGGGFKYRDEAGTSDGIVAVVLRTGVDGKAGIDVKGKGPGLAASPVGLPTPPLGLPLRVQLQIEGGACFEADYGAAGVRKNQDGTFRGDGS